uniref:RNA-directed DNA polymerase homolog n=2 Tax=Nicotiana TaxID=4085 RepID=A0A1S4D7C9_TOBAC|nr:PREDICTED: uncharacterized protein LOC104232252 [Nicotiana sylvestris]XP_016509345.1 PREDICTED: uncharacterized protein LOC107826826 [Nicotiana tabacum]
MKLEDRIVPRCITLTGFNNAIEQTFGEIAQPVLAGGITLETMIHIMDQDTTYNAIIGQPWIYAIKAIPSSLYQVIKFPTLRGYSASEESNSLPENAITSAKTVHMSGIPKEISTHKLNADPFYIPVRKVRRKFNSAINDAVREKVEKMLENGSIRELKYPQWVANVIMVKKKNGKWRMCVDFTDLNKARPKD